MKKIIWAFVAMAVLASAAFVIHQNRPIKRHARHLIKARLFAQEGNFMAARLEYEKAFNITGKFTPFVTQEVMQLVNRMSLADKNPKEALENTRKFTQAHPDNKEGWVTLADLAFQAGEAGAAFSAIESALALDTAYFPARLLLGRVRTQQGRLDLAEDQLRFLFRRYPDSLPALLPLADNLLRQGQVAESRQFLLKARELNPKNSAIWLLLVDGYLFERKIDSAQVMLSAWLAADPDAALNAALRKSRLHALGNHLDSARDALKPFLEKKQENLPAYSELALLYARQERYDSAIQVYSLIQEIQPAAMGEVLYYKACLHLRDQNPARALEALKMLKIGEQGNSLHLLMAGTYLALGQNHKVDEMVKQYPDSVQKSMAAVFAQLEPDPGFIGLWAVMNYFQSNKDAYSAYQAIKELYGKWPRSALATALYVGALTSLQKHAEAAAVLEKLQKPTLPQNIALMQAYARGGKEDKAKAVAEKIAAQHPAQRGINQFLANYHLVRKDRRKSTEYLLKEFALDTTNVVAINNLAWEYGIMQSDLEKAKPFLDRLRRGKTLDPRILDTMGWILAKNGSPEGEEYLRWALSLVPDHPTYQYHMAWHLARTNRTADAMTRLKTALESPIPFGEREEAKLLSSQLQGGVAQEAASNPK